MIIILPLNSLNNYFIAEWTPFLLEETVSPPCSEPGNSQQRQWGGQRESRARAEMWRWLKGVFKPSKGKGRFESSKSFLKSSDPEKTYTCTVSLPRKDFSDKYSGYPGSELSKLNCKEAKFTPPTTVTQTPSSTECRLMFLATFLEKRNNSLRASETPNSRPKKHIKPKERDACAAAQIDLGNIILSKVSHTEKDKYMISLICGI